MNWNHYLSQAPRGKMVHSTRAVGDRVHEISDFVADHIWAASKCGKVIKSYWIPPVGKAAGCWSGFATGEAPIAWQRFVVPEHPFAAATTSEAALTKAPTNVSLPVDERSGERANAGGDHVTVGENAHQISAGELVSNSSAPILEDVGGGA
jgi:hypothetical protein